MLHYQTGITFEAKLREFCFLRYYIKLVTSEVAGQHDRIARQFSR